MKTHLLYLAASVILLGVSCDNNTGTEARAPIKLGDSATIVIEKDSQFLKDEVMDLVPDKTLRPDTSVTLPAKKGATVAVKDTVVKEQRTIAGHTLNLGTATMVFAGLATKEGRRQNPEQDNDLVYALNTGDLGTSRIVFSGVKEVAVKQRYQSRLLLQSALGTVDLRDLGLYTSGWNTIPASNTGATTTFSLNGLKHINYTQVNNNKIKNATDRELRKRRTSSRTIQNWMKEIRRVNTADDAPCHIILDNVQWQVSGTDAKGKKFRKTIRIDV